MSAMAYFDLIVRSISEPGLIQLVIRFLLDEEKFDGQRILDVLVERLNSNDPRVGDLQFKRTIQISLILLRLMVCCSFPLYHPVVHGHAVTVR